VSAASGAPAARPIPETSHAPHRALSEAVTMALYVCIVLTTELAVLSERADAERVALTLLWASTIGLTLAHVFAFHLAEKLFAGGRLDAEARLAIALQVAAAVIIAAALSIPILVLELSAALTVAAWMAAGLVGITAVTIARLRGRTHVQTALAGALTLAVAAGVVALKARFAHI